MQRDFRRISLKTFSPRVHLFSKLNPRFAFQSCQSALLKVKLSWHLALRIKRLWRQAFSIVRWANQHWTAPSPKRKRSFFKLRIKPDALAFFFLLFYRGGLALQTQSQRSWCSS